MSGLAPGHRTPRRHEWPHGFKLSHFRREEFTSPAMMNRDLLLTLDDAREWAGVPFRITSSYRAGDPGAHGRGYAVDIACTESRARLKIVRALILEGFHRIGVYDRHIHADRDPTLPGEVMWLGESK